MSDSTRMLRVDDPFTGAVAWELPLATADDALSALQRAAAAQRELARSPLRAFAERLARGGRFRATMLPTAEGLALGVKLR